MKKEKKKMLFTIAQVTVVTTLFLTMSIDKRREHKATVKIMQKCDRYRGRQQHFKRILKGAVEAGDLKFIESFIKDNEAIDKMENEPMSKEDKEKMDKYILEVVEEQEAEEEKDRLEKMTFKEIADELNK